MMKDLKTGLVCLLLCMLLSACGSSSSRGETAETPPAPTQTVLNAAYLPQDDQILMVVGQDLSAVRGYTAVSDFPTPGGVTTYTNLYLLADEDRLYAGLGLDNNLEPIDGEADWWGSGPYSAWKMAEENPDSALVIGLDITEQYAENGLARLAEGQFDAQIDKLGGFIRKLDRPVFLRIGYEFDGVWNAGYQNTQNYTNAWRYIVTRLRAQDTHNMATVWQSSTSPADDAIEGTFEADLSIWYPGDAYVDWIGFSWFLTPDQHGTNANAPSTQKQLADQLLDFARDRNKPVMCAESSPQGYFIEAGFKANIGTVVDGPSGENRVAKTPQEIWDEWYAPLIDYMEANRDIIRAWAYINVHWDAQPKWGPPYKEGLWGDSRVQANADLMERWLSELAKNTYLHGGPDLTTRLSTP